MEAITLGLICLGLGLLSVIISCIALYIAIKWDKIDCKYKIQVLRSEILQIQYEIEDQLRICKEDLQYIPSNPTTEEDKKLMDQWSTTLSVLSSYFIQSFNTYSELLVFTKEVFDFSVGIKMKIVGEQLVSLHYKIQAYNKDQVIDICTKLEKGRRNHPNIKKIKKELLKAGYSI